MREKSKGSFGAWVNDGAARCKEWNGFGVGTAEGDRSWRASGGRFHQESL